MTKGELRRQMRAWLRDGLTPALRAEKSREICEAVAQHPAYQAARTVAIFDAMPSEPHVERLWEIAPRRFMYPRIDGHHLLLIEVADRTMLRAHPAGAKFREPEHDDDRVVPISAIDLILVPGLAFTREGWRLGRGGGYYDRLLPLLRPDAIALGVCFAEQIVERLPVEGHDMRMDGVIADGS
jgi:5-formyltetrahydrofolate cyclo-ligase